MAVSVISGWESGLGPVMNSYVLVRDCICFRPSSSSLGNNPSLQNHSFGRNWGKLQSEMRTDKWDFLLCPDETQPWPICCRLFLFIMNWSWSTLFFPFFCNALLGMQAQYANFFLNVSLEHDSSLKNIVYLVACLVQEISVHAWLCSIYWRQFFTSLNFWGWMFFPHISCQSCMLL